MHPALRPFFQRPELALRRGGALLSSSARAPERDGSSRQRVVPFPAGAMRKQLPFLVAAAIAVALAIPATYAAQRAVDVLFRGPEPNPATIVWSAHLAMFWRLAIGAYVAAMVAPLVYVAARRNLARTLRLLCACVLPVAILIGAQGLLMP
jgi:hypothetical protein